MFYKASVPPHQRPKPHRALIIHIMLQPRRGGRREVGAVGKHAQDGERTAIFFHELYSYL